MITGVDGDTIVEYKTGEPRPEHEAQSRLYALLWWHRSRRPVRQRRLLYADHEVVLAGLAEQELRDEAAALRHRVATARLDVSRYPPPARPAVDKCRPCSVRQLCGDYWHAPETEEDRWTPGKLATLAGAGESSAVVQWGDLEIDLAGVEEEGDRFAVGLAASPDIRLLCPVPPNRL